jgi:succinate-semialdehyde dehydrogenase/glutarate-semialdehyde dehydrogenase
LAPWATASSTCSCTLSTAAWWINGPCVTPSFVLDVPGYFFEPTVLSDVQSCKVDNEETFGPLAPLYRAKRLLIVDLAALHVREHCRLEEVARNVDLLATRFKTEDEAIEIANNTEVGLAG